jgi:dihydrofolate reductase
MQQALPVGLVEEFRLHVVSVLIGGGTALFARLAEAVSLQRTDVFATPSATHLPRKLIWGRSRDLEPPSGLLLLTSDQ